MASPPSDAPVLFGIEFERSKFKLRKNGSFKLVLKGVEKLQWETNDDEEEEGKTNAARYVNNFKKYYGKNAEVDAYKLFALENRDMYKIKFMKSRPRYNKRNDVLTYDITPKNKKHLAKITGIEGEPQTKGVVYSNESTRWRPHWMPDGVGRNLSNADLSNADLRYADLNGADLSDADLSDADLIKATLSLAVLSNANLQNANLRGAKLVGAALSDADLSSADLRDADLRGANMWGAYLSNNTELTGTIWELTTCPNGTMNIGSSPCTIE